MTTIVISKKTIFSKKEALLGDPNGLIFIEHLKLTTKEYIYISKLNDEIPTFQNLIRKIKHKIEIEKLCTHKLKFEKKWEIVLRVQ